MTPAKDLATKREDRGCIAFSYTREKGEQGASVVAPFRDEERELDVVDRAEW